MAAKAAATKAPKDETAEQKFSRIASQRTSRAIKALRSVRKVTGHGYTYNDEQAQKVVKALADEVNAIQAAFKTNGQSASEDVFSV